MRNAALVLTLGLMAFGSGASAQRVAYDYDRGTDFSGLKTYAWAAGANLNDELNHERIVAAVDSQLLARGMSRAEPGATPDVLVAYHVAFAQDIKVRAYSSDWGRVRTGASASGTARSRRVVLGVLAVQMVDPETRSTVWRASIRREVDLTANPDERERNIRKATDKLFRHFPVKP